MKIYLIRHGETDWNKAGKLQGSADIPLNEYGVELAQITSEQMKDIPLEIIYSSPLNRAHTTAQIMRRGREIPIIVDERLREMDFGMYEGMIVRDAGKSEDHPLHDFISHPEKYRPLEGEEFSGVITRAHSFIDEVLCPLQDNYEHVMLAVHGAFIRCFLRCVEERPLSEFWSGIPQKNCAVTTIELKDDRLRILEEGKLYYEI